MQHLDVMDLHALSVSLFLRRPSNNSLATPLIPIQHCPEDADLSQAQVRNLRSQLGSNSGGDMVPQPSVPNEGGDQGKLKM